MPWACVLLLAVCPVALAHGGRGFPGPNGGVPPGLREPEDPGPPPEPPSDQHVMVRQVGLRCDCGLVECLLCDRGFTRGGKATTTLGERWGDVARCRVEIRFDAWCGTTESHAQVEPGPLFAAVAGSVMIGDGRKVADLKPCAEARRAYLHARRDPMLVLRRGPGRVDVRVRRTGAGVPAKVVLEGYVLVDSPRIEPVRLYRTGDRFLAVTHDWQGGRRSLHFLCESACRERFGARAAEEVPFVPALESAATGCGKAAACDETALAVIAPETPQPPFVGPDRWIAYKLRPAPDPSDPEPPPPVPLDS